MGGFDLFHVKNNNQNISAYNERRTGGALRLGYEISDHLRQALSYSIVDRNVFNVSQNASLYIQNQQGGSLLSQIGQTLTLDYRDSRTAPHSGFVVNYGLDVAGLGGTAHYVRNKLDGVYYIPLERLHRRQRLGHRAVGRRWLSVQPAAVRRTSSTGSSWVATTSAASSRAAPGPHSQPIQAGGVVFGSDSIGGKFIYTQSTELRFPLPISADLGLSGRAFVDVGGLSNVSQTGNLFARNVYRHPDRRRDHPAHRRPARTFAARRHRRRRVVAHAVRSHQHRRGRACG